MPKKGLAAIMPRIRSLLKEQGWRFIDGLTVLPQEPAFCGDGFLHPNDLGFSICARVFRIQRTKIIPPCLFPQAGGYFMKLKI